MSVIKPNNPVLQSSHTLAQGLVGCWPLTGLTANGDLDLSEYGNHATFVDSANLSWIDTPYGKALNHTNATNDMLTVADNNSLDITGPFTIIALVYLGVDSYNWLNILRKQGAATNTTPYDFYRDRASDRLGLRVMSQALVSGNATAYINTSQWYHVAISFNDAKLASFYVDGVVAGTTGPYSSFPGVSTYPLFIGTSWQGAFAGLWLYNRSFTASEVASHYTDPWVMLRPQAAGMFLPQLLQSGEYGGY